MVRLDIISDPICPWCYIGKTHLDRALAENPDHPFVMEWHPFQLNPDMPPEGMDRRAYLEQKFGGKEGAIRVYSQIEQAAIAAGIDIDFAAIKRTPNTINAHRLIHWGGLEARQTAIVDRLFKAYFEMGLDIGDADILADIAEDAGLDRAVIRRLLDGDSDVHLMQERDAHSRKMGVSGVPCFVVDQRHAVSGAQQPDTWANIIREINEQLAEGETDQLAEGDKGSPAATS